MKKEYQIKLKAQEKKELSGIIKKGSEQARKITRCRILLLMDEGQSKAAVSKALSVDPNTIRNICRRVFDGKFKAKLTALACSEPPEGRNKWSLRLLADKAVELEYIDSISHTDVGRLPYSATHVMRHGGCRRVYNEVPDTAIAQQLLGNSNLQSVLVYAKRNANALTEVAQAEWERRKP